MKNLFMKVGMITLLFALIIGVGASPVLAKKIVIKAVSFLPKPAKVMKTYGMYIKMVNERAKGELVIKWVGGPDVIPKLDQANAVRSGVIDMAALPASYYMSIVPTAFNTCVLSEYTPMEERKVGIFDFQLEEHANAGMRYLGHLETNHTFHCGVKTKVTSPKGLAGKKIRSMGLYNYFIKALGSSPVKVPHPEVYTALERGLVDGYMFPFSDVADLSLFEVCKYFIDHTFYENGNLVSIMNLKKWNKIPKHLQKVMIDAMIELEPQMYEIFARDQAAARKKMIAKGMVPIKFSPADAKAYRALAFSSFEGGAKELCPPDKFAKMMKLVKK